MSPQQEASLHMTLYPLLQDQRAALQWLHDNAGVLGVNTSRIMIFGESAGAGSVSTHLVQPASWPLFTRAAMESGPPAADWLATNMDNANQRILRH